MDNVRDGSTACEGARNLEVNSGIPDGLSDALELIVEARGSGSEQHAVRFKGEDGVEPDGRDGGYC